jgi:hypothetical protein
MGKVPCKQLPNVGQLISQQLEFLSSTFLFSRHSLEWQDWHLHQYLITMGNNYACMAIVQCQLHNHFDVPLKMWARKKLWHQSTLPKDRSIWPTLKNFSHEHNWRQNNILEQVQEASYAMRWRNNVKKVIWLCISSTLMIKLIGKQSQITFFNR